MGEIRSARNGTKQHKWSSDGVIRQLLERQTVKTVSENHQTECFIALSKDICLVYVIIPHYVIVWIKILYNNFKATVE